MSTNVRNYDFNSITKKCCEDGGYQACGLDGYTLCSYVEAVCKRLLKITESIKSDFIALKLEGNNTARVYGIYQSKVEVKGRFTFTNTSSIALLSSSLGIKNICFSRDFILASKVGLRLNIVEQSITNNSALGQLCLIFGKYISNSLGFEKDKPYIQVQYEPNVEKCLFNCYKLLLSNLVDMRVENQDGEVFIVVNRNEPKVFAKNTTHSNFIGKVDDVGKDCFNFIIDYMRRNQYTYCKTLVSSDGSIHYYFD